MSLAGKWRIVEMPDFDADYPDMSEPAYILFNGDHSGAFAFGRVTAHIWAASATEAEFIDFSWSGSDEFDEIHGDGDAELQPDGSLHGEITFHHGDEYSFIAKKWTFQQPARLNRQIQTNQIEVLQKSPISSSTARRWS